MAERVVLHVGAMKSGTSYLQGQLFANKELLAGEGILVPGETWWHQVQGVLDVLGRTGRVKAAEPWDRLTREVQDWSSTAVFSMEFLGPVAPRLAQQVVASFPGNRVEVVITARDLNRSIAAMWQETLQNGRSWSWPDYLEGVATARPFGHQPNLKNNEAGRRFWRQQNVARMAETWSTTVGVDTAILITLPHPGAPPHILQERFAKAVGFDPTLMKTGPRANASVGAASAEVLRRVNALLASRGLPWPHGAGLRKQQFAKGILASRSGVEPRIGLPVPDWVATTSALMVEALIALRVPLIGDWGELEPVPVPGIDPTAVDGESVRDAARDGLDRLDALLAESAGVTEPDSGRVGQPGHDAATVDVMRLADRLERAIRTREDT